MRVWMRVRAEVEASANIVSGGGCVRVCGAAGGLGARRGRATRAPRPRTPRAIARQPQIWITIAETRKAGFERPDRRFQLAAEVLYQ